MPGGASGRAADAPGREPAMRDGDPSPAPDGVCGPNPFAACEERAVVRLVLADGSARTGSYTGRAGLHFLHRTGPGLPLIGEISGPYLPGDVLAVEVVQTRAQVLEDARAPVTPMTAVA